MEPEFVDCSGAWAVKKEPEEIEDAQVKDEEIKDEEIKDEGFLLFKDENEEMEIFDVNEVKLEKLEEEDVQEPEDYDVTSLAQAIVKEEPNIEVQEEYSQNVNSLRSITQRAESSEWVSPAQSPSLTEQVGNTRNRKELTPGTLKQYTPGHVKKRTLGNVKKRTPGQLEEYTPVRIKNCTLGTFKEHTSRTLKKHTPGTLEERTCATYTVQKRYKCSQCEKCFIYSTSLASHKLTHTGDKRFDCTICGFSSANLGSLKNHMSTHESATPPVKDEVTQTMVADPSTPDSTTLAETETIGSVSLNGNLSNTSYSSVKNHMGQLQSTRIVKNSYKCTECSFSCNFFYDLDYHMNVHTRKTGGESFDSVSDLDVYNQTHNPEQTPSTSDLRGNRVETYLSKLREKKPFNCKLCNKRFYSASSHNKHKLTMHSEKNPYKCTLCRDSFTTLRKFQNHIEKHMEAHFKCDLCDLTFSTRKKCFKHQSTHIIKNSYICTVCSFSCNSFYDLDQHMKVHSREMGGESCDSEGDLDLYIQTLNSVDDPEQTPSTSELWTNNSIEPNQSKLTGKKQFNCKECNKMFIDSGSLQRHNRIHKKKCKICDKVFTNLSELKEHRRIHSEEKKLYKCKVCDHTSNNYNSYNYHMNIHSREMAGESFDYVSDLDLHNLTQNAVEDPETTPRTSELKGSNCVEPNQSKLTEKEPFNCKVCKKFFIDSGSLQRHNRIHTRKCKICDKVFTNLSELKEHSQIHSEGKQPYKCKVCNHTSSNYNSYNYHMTLHTKITFTCEVCEKEFETSQCLEAHKKIHKQDKNPQNSLSNEHSSQDRHHMAKGSFSDFSCEICNKTFISSSYLEVHKKQHGAGIFKCKLCVFTSSNPASLEKHMTLHQGSSGHLCDECGKTFTLPADLFRHRRTHERNAKSHSTYKCTVCTATFKTFSGLTEHLQSHEDNCYECDWCDYAVADRESLKKHLRLEHDMDKFLECEKCSKIFADENSLTEHSKIHLSSVKCDYDNSLEKHVMSKQTRAEASACEDCGKVFMDSRHRNAHKRTRQCQAKSKKGFKKKKT